MSPPVCNHQATCARCAIVCLCVVEKFRENVLHCSRTSHTKIQHLNEFDRKKNQSRYWMKTKRRHIFCVMWLLLLLLVSLFQHFNALSNSPRFFFSNAIANTKLVIRPKFNYDFFFTIPRYAGEFCVERKWTNELNERAHESCRP